MDLSTYRLIQSVKRLDAQWLTCDGGRITLADKLYLDTLSTAFRELSTTPAELVIRMIAKTLAAARIGEIPRRDFERLSNESKQALAAALGSMVPTAVQAELRLEVEANLPILHESKAPSFAFELVRRPRAGYEGPDGARFQGSRPESQAAHALSTAVIAGLQAGCETALCALMHNAHLALSPDVPHLVEAAIGGERARSIETEARRQLLRAFPAGCEDHYLFQAIEHSPSPEVEAALDEADFIDRTLWLIEIAPPWLDLGNAEELRRVLCNEDQRQGRQIVILDQILQAVEPLMRDG